MCNLTVEFSKAIVQFACTLPQGNRHFRNIPKSNVEPVDKFLTDNENTDTTSCPSTGYRRRRGERAKEHGS